MKIGGKSIPKRGDSWFKSPEIRMNLLIQRTERGIVWLKHSEKRGIRG